MKRVRGIARRDRNSFTARSAPLQFDKFIPIRDFVRYRIKVHTYFSVKSKGVHMNRSLQIGIEIPEKEIKILLWRSPEFFCNL